MDTTIIPSNLGFTLDFCLPLSSPHYWINHQVLLILLPKHFFSPSYHHPNLGHSISGYSTEVASLPLCPSQFHPPSVPEGCSYSPGSGHTTRMPQSALGYRSSFCARHRGPQWSSRSHCSLLPALPSSKAELLITTAHPIPHTYLLPVLGCAPDATPTPGGASLRFLAPHNLDNCYSSSRPQFRPTSFRAPSLARHVGGSPTLIPGWLSNTILFTLHYICFACVYFPHEIGPEATFYSSFYTGPHHKTQFSQYCWIEKWMTSWSPFQLWGFFCFLLADFRNC